MARVGRLDDPNIFLAFVLLKLLVVVIKIAEFIRENVGVGYEIESCLSEAFLHAHHIKTEPVLASDLVTLREVVDLLVFIKALVLVRLAAA